MIGVVCARRARRPLRLLLAVLAVLAWCVAPAALAHKPSDSYLSLQVADRQIDGQLDLALRDLDYAVGLDDNQDGAISWGELRAHHADIAAYALARLELSAADAPCPTRAGEQLVDQHTDGSYAVLRFNASCPVTPATLRVRYGLFFDVDPQHRGLLRLQHAAQTRTAIFSTETPTQAFELGDASRLRTFVAYGAHGAWHIWVGFDHLLFLLSLLLPAVLIRVDRAWAGAYRFSDCCRDAVKVISAFTLAHSITLSLAALGVVQLPSRAVEAVIAASVIVAALNNLVPLARNSRWLLAFVFGLIHGFGFASVLTDLGLPQASLLLALVGFNVGVELGQLAVVAVFLPLAWVVRKRWIYRQGVLAGGSLLVIAMASVWLIERAFNLKLLL